MEPLRLSSETFYSNKNLDEAQRQELAGRVADLDVAGKLALKKPLYSVYGPHSYPVRSCNESNVKHYKKWFQVHSLNETLNEKDFAMLKDHIATNWTKHAVDATHRLIQAFELAQVPLIIAAGSHLGWYRQCGIIEHTNDIDFYALSEYFVSLDHFDLLVVCWCMLFVCAEICRRRCIFMEYPGRSECMGHRLRRERT